MGLPTLHQVNILGTVLGAVATTVTIWRLIYRKLDSKLWWDDAWAFVAMLNAWALVACVWVIFAPPDSTVSQHARVVAFYILEVCFTFSIWAARLSILWTIIRITPDRKARRYLHMVAGGFITFCLLLCAQKFWVCIPQPGWTDVPGGTCDLGKQVAVCEIVTDVIGDIILVAVPVRMLWNIKITKALRLRLITVFSMSIITTIVSLCQNYYLINDGGIRDFIVSHVEIETAVTVCNLNVLMAAIWRFIQKVDLDETGNSRGPSRGGPAVSGIATVGTMRNRPYPASAFGRSPITPPAIHIQTETYEYSSSDDSKITPTDYDLDLERGTGEKPKKLVDSDSELDLESGPEHNAREPNSYPMQNYSRGINLH